MRAGERVGNGQQRLGSRGCAPFVAGRDTLDTFRAPHVRFRAVRSRVSRGAGRDPSFRAPKPCRLTAPPPTPSSARPRSPASRGALHDLPPFGLVEPERMGDRRPAHDGCSIIAAIVGRELEHGRNTHPLDLLRQHCPAARARPSSPGEEDGLDACVTELLRDLAAEGGRGRDERPVPRGRRSDRAVASIRPSSASPATTSSGTSRFGSSFASATSNPPWTHSYRPGSSLVHPTGGVTQAPARTEGSRSGLPLRDAPPRSREPRAHSRDPPPGPAAGRDRLHPLPPCLAGELRKQELDCPLCAGPPMVDVAAEPAREISLIVRRPSST